MRDLKDIYREELRCIININDNFAIMYSGGRLDLLPRDAKNDTDGNKLAVKLLPAINKVLNNNGYKGEVMTLKPSRKNKPLYGAIKIVEL